MRRRTLVSPKVSSSFPRRAGRHHLHMGYYRPATSQTTIYFYVNLDDVDISRTFVWAPIGIKLLGKYFNYNPAKTILPSKLSIFMYVFLILLQSIFMAFDILVSKLSSS